MGKKGVSGEIDSFGWSWKSWINPTEVNTYIYSIRFPRPTFPTPTEVNTSVGKVGKVGYFQPNGITVSYIQLFQPKQSRLWWEYDGNAVRIGVGFGWQLNNEAGCS